MLRYLLQRLLVLIPTFLGVTLLTFSLIRLIPGDPVEVMMGERTLDPELHAAALSKLGLDQPLYVQYGRYLSDLLRGNLGQSLKTQANVWTEFKALFPATLELALMALLIALVFGLIAGVMAAVRRGSWLDHTVMTAALTGYSMPIFWWGLLLILIFSVGLGWTPVSGRLDLMFDVPPQTGFMLIDAWLAQRADPELNSGALWDAVRHLILPA
ncbi:MAG: ABC transporter permease subunit, partial [Hydrogenophaga sp.]|nr:ABC transporter permease subunit [Hydrogenophaga sp.]